jgi:hypothetical protein
MDLLHRVSALLLRPSREWRAIAPEPGVGRIIRHVAVLAVIPPLARFIGASLVGGYAPISSSLIGAAIGYLASLAAVYALALIMHVTAPGFGAKRSFSAALKLAAYSPTPFWLAGLFLSVPGLSFLVVLGLQGAYLLWVGLPILLRTPTGRALPFAAVMTGCAIVIVILINAIEAPLFGPPHG